MLQRILAAAAAIAFYAAAARARPAPQKPEHDVTAQTVVLELPGMVEVAIRKGVSYKKTEKGDLTLDLYYPGDFRPGTARPAVVFINGVGDQPGSKLKDWAIYQSWGRLVAAAGWIGVTFEARGPYTDSRPDIQDLFAFLGASGAPLGIDAGRIGAWVCSGNVYSGLPFLMEEAVPGVLCAVVYYGTGNPAKLRADLPVFFARAGRDNRQLNEGIDALWVRAVAAGAPWTLVNAPASHHAFDALDETDESRRIVRLTLDFFSQFLSAPPGRPAQASEERRALAPWFAHEYTEAEAEYSAYVKRHPSDATAWMRLGLSQAHVRRFSEAEASIQRALSLGADRPTDLYNAACGFALAGRTDRALGALERAVAAGFRNLQLLSSDADLASLRGQKRFEDLLKKLE